MSVTTAKSMAMLPWWPGAFMSATRGWSVTARGVYRELLDAQWDMGTLPADPVELQRVIGATAPEWEEGWAKCASKFIGVPGGLQNPRLEEHRMDSLNRRLRKQEGARLANEAKAKRRNAERNAERDAQRDAERTPTPTATSTPTPPNSGVSSGDSRPLARTSKERPAYEIQEFHQQVIDAYHELLPDLPAVKVWSKKRDRALSARITERLRDGKPADQISYWREFFGIVGGSDFLCGRSTDFRADLEWLLRPESFAKVIEGRYVPRAVANGAAAHGR